MYFDLFHYGVKLHYSCSRQLSNKPLDSSCVSRIKQGKENWLPTYQDCGEGGGWRRTAFIVKCHTMILTIVGVYYATMNVLLARHQIRLHPHQPH